MLMASALRRPAHWQGESCDLGAEAVDASAFVPYHARLCESSATRLSLSDVTLETVCAVIQPVSWC